MLNVMIDGRPSADFTDDDLVAINQKLGEKVDAIQLQRKIINAVLSRRRVEASARAQARAAGLSDAAVDAVAGEAVRAYESTDGAGSAIAPGATIETRATA